MNKQAWIALVLFFWSAVSSGELQARPGDVLAMASTEEKKRVPKDEEQKKKEKEREKEAERTHKGTESNDDGSCWGICFFDAIGSLFGGQEENTTAEHLTEVTGSAGQELGSGVLVRADSSQDAVQLWSGPGGAARGYEIVATLTPGIAVGVTDRAVLEEDTWLEVRSYGSQPDAGWVPAVDVDWVSSGVPAQVPSEPTAPVEPASTTQLPGVVLGVDLSLFELVGPTDVRQEYTGFFRGGVSALFALGNTIQVELVGGFGDADGEPQYNYEYLGGARQDSPHNSKVEIGDVGIRVGQYMQVGRLGHFYWGAGPMHYWVQESADVDSYSLPSGLPLGTSHVSKKWSRWGADFAVGGSYQTSKRIHVGVQARLFWISWEGERLESLTLDHVGERSIVGLGVVGTFGLDVF